MISIEFSGREGAGEALCERREVLQHISATFARNYFYPTADILFWNNSCSCTRANVSKKMDRIYCLCDIFISIALDHVYQEKKLAQFKTQPFEILLFQLINPDPELLPSWSRLRGSLVESFLSKHLAGLRSEPRARKVGLWLGSKLQQREASLAREEEAMAGNSDEERREERWPCPANQTRD